MLTVLVDRVCLVVLTGVCWVAFGMIADVTAATEGTFGLPFGMH